MIANNFNENYLYKNCTIVEMIEHQSELIPDKTALIYEDKILTYSEINEFSNKISNAILSKGINKQNCVAYLGKETETYYGLLLGCAKSGMILVPINWRLKSNEILHILLDSESRLLFVSRDMQELISPILPQLSLLKEVVWIDGDSGNDSFDSFIEKAPQTSPLVKVDADDILAQMYTSGTTGLPKGVRLKHHAFFEIRTSLIQNKLNWIDWKYSDICLIGIPGFHIGGLWWAIQVFSSGATNLSLPFFTPSRALETILKHKATQICVVPSMLQLLMREMKNTKTEVSSLRRVVYGGSPISESLLSKCIEELGCEFSQIFGLTETGNTAVCLDPQSHLDRKNLKAAGRPYPCVNLKVINSDGVTLENNKIGEVCIHTPAHMESYWKLSKETADTLQDGWVHTGDAGYIDERGYLFIVDRIKDVIIVAGENIYPCEVENEIDKNGSVKECAVIGVPDTDWGESVVAFVVLEQGTSLSQKEIHNFLRKNLADFKIPEKFYFVEKLPRNPSGKILRRELRNIFWEKSSRNI
ncbi:long-chain-fatty-acid--CoA ligase [Photorhabdus tasmaniensis]|uniref:long-chain-fatty-acid--CoA ligase n=1 Tax=Photorhabdus tasmaniensis TaxID=1004159 RepID=UPI004041EA55